jgi:hypothetical protein
MQMRNKGKDPAEKPSGTTRKNTRGENWIGNSGFSAACNSWLPRESAIYNCRREFHIVLFHFRHD